MCTYIILCSYLLIEVMVPAAKQDCVSRSLFNIFKICLPQLEKKFYILRSYSVHMLALADDFFFGADAGGWSVLARG